MSINTKSDAPLSNGESDKVHSLNCNDLYVARVQADAGRFVNPLQLSDTFAFLDAQGTLLRNWVS